MIYVKTFEDGRIVRAVQMMFTGRLTVARDAESDKFGYDDMWCYNTLGEAIAAGHNWDGTGEPVGWHRHPPTGRRRPNGDAAKEYIAP